MVAEYRYSARPWTLNAERRGSTHWSATRAKTEEWRRAFWALGLQSRRRFSEVVIEVEVEMRPPLADTGNCYGSVKAAIDGLVDAGVLPGDTGNVVRELRFLAPRRVVRASEEGVLLRLIPCPPVVADPEPLDSTP